jgi:hypothetical protein
MCLCSILNFSPCSGRNPLAECSTRVGWDIAFEDLEPADLEDRIRAIRIVRVAGEKPILDTLYDYVVHVVCSVGIYKVYQEPVAPSCTGLAVVQEGIIM